MIGTAGVGRQKGTRLEMGKSARQSINTYLRLGVQSTEKGQGPAKGRGSSDEGPGRMAG